MMSTNLQYKQNNRRLIQALFILLYLNFVSTVAAFYLQLNQKEPLYYQVIKDANGKIAGKQMRGLMDPIINRQNLLNWASEAATATYTYDQANYQQQIQNAINTYFTAAGGRSFKAALDKSGIINQIVSQKLDVTAVVEQPPAILKAGMLLGHFTWKVQMPILVTYVSASEKQAYRYILTMSIIRLPRGESANGVGINQIWVQTA